MARATTVDVHAHFFPESYLRIIEDAGAAFGARVDRSNPKGPVIVTRDGRTAPLEASYWDLDLRRKAMDRAGIDVHALSLTAPMVYFADGEVGTRLAVAVNNAMAEAHRAFPGRFVGCATLPLQEPRRALTELDRALGLPGIRGVYFGTNVNGRDLSDPAFEPIYARCEAARVPLLLHPLPPQIGGERLRPFYLTNLLGNPFENAIAAAHLVFGGVLDRHPKLEVVLPHSGGALPILFGRLTRGQAVRPENKGVAKKPLRAYLRRFTYDTITHAPEPLAYLIDLVGVERVVLGSDYCFDMGYARPRHMVERRLGLSKADQAKILGSTAARLLRLR
jgi:aminocarboxymuconate-semialdehyde decarboxylase